MARPMTEVTTEDLIATIAYDRDCVSTFEARAEFTRRTGQGWRVYAPVKPRARVQGINWHNFVEENA